MAPKAFIFDVFGTLVDWRSSIARTLAPVHSQKGIEANPLAVADAWRGEYQPAMARIRDGNRGYVALDVLHRENLETVLGNLGAADQFTPSEITDLARAWEVLDPWPDVVNGLKRLRKIGLIAPCSNGSIALMSHLARHAGFNWDCILGAEIARNYKPNAAVYLASCAALGLAPADVMMVAAHNSDLIAARKAGLQTGFFPRPLEHGDPAKAELSATSDFEMIAEDLEDLARQLGA
ncbi:MAG: haloacid dehalogenase type II [Marinosulfonomonas sp.]|nr:haloacid dehalogenase type II [Marinosulfonomonas sp.]